jgi:hypothetical protein
MNKWIYVCEVDIKYHAIFLFNLQENFPKVKLKSSPRNSRIDGKRMMGIYGLLPSPHPNEIARKFFNQFHRLDRGKLMGVSK